MLLVRARPGPLFRICHEPGFYGVPFDIHANTFFFSRISCPMIERFVLPERFACSSQNPVCASRCDAFNSTRNPSHCDSWLKQNMDVVRHDHIRAQNILVKFVLTSAQSAHNGICNRRILQPKRTEPCAIQMPIEIDKLLP